MTHISIIEDKVLWDKFVDESPYGLLFHKWDFLKIMEEHSGYHLQTYGIYNSLELISVFPLFYKNTMGIKVLVSPPPRTGVPYLGFVMCRNYDTLKQNKKECYLNIVASEINKEIKRVSPNYLQVSTVPNFCDIRPFQWQNYNIIPRYTYVLSLNKELDDIWNNLTKNYKRKLRKAERLNLKVSTSDDPSVLFYHLDERYKEQCMASPNFSRHYLQDLLKCFSNELVCYCVYAANQRIQTPLTSILVHKYKRFILWLGGAKTEDSVNQYLTWELVKKAKEEGYERFEDQGANTMHLCGYKRGINPSLEIYHWIGKKDIFGKLGEWTFNNLMTMTNRLKKRGECNV